MRNIKANLRLSTVECSSTVAAFLQLFRLPRYFITALYVHTFRLCLVENTRHICTQANGQTIVHIVSYIDVHTHTHTHTRTVYLFL
ncbi:hypothetical protein FBUS_04123 [Fasciolopsis buskii]|uniref:Uncharacterized protein n=1 Tax=Fasciolopsis buskii TaxID=27845 RepID=A0A8E0RJ65_9TREM|nr:hypothetical protein FBUS_04123 [Fasciolopsis buski]